MQKKNAKKKIEIKKIEINFSNYNLSNIYTKMSNQLYNERTSMNVLTVYYSVQSVFRIPVGLDLNNPRMVKDHFIKWNVLHINLANGETMEIEGVLGEDDYKYPQEDSEEIDDAEDIGQEYLFNDPSELDDQVAEMLQDLMLEDGVIVLPPPPIARIQTITIGEQTDDQIVAECLENMIDRIQDEETNKIKENECPVCMEQFDDEDRMAMNGVNCQHLICSADFETLASSTNCCPICRVKLLDNLEGESDSDCEFNETSSDESDEEFADILNGDARMTAQGIMIVRVEDAWINFDAISSIHHPADQALLMQFIYARQALIQGNGNGGRNETGCRYCGIQENGVANQYYLSMLDNINYCDMEIGADMNHLFYRDGVCPLCKFVETHSCDTCSRYDTDNHLRHHECGIISDIGVSVCLTCEGEMEEEDPSLFIRCRDAGCALCENYQSDSD